jgi:hypothetical protein
MTDQPNFRVPQVRLPLFTLDPSHTGGRKSRTGLEFQDHYTACVLAEFFAGREDFYVARIEAVEDLETIVRTESGWVERYYQIKSRQEGGGQWTLAALASEGVWARFFSLYRQFMEQKLETARQLELVVVVEGDLSRELIELREKGLSAATAKAKLLSILTAAKSPESHASASPDQFQDVLINGFISTLRFESRVGNLQELTLNRLMESGDLSPGEAQNLARRLLTSIKAESLLTQATVITLQVLKDWLGIPQREMFQKKPEPDPYEVDRKDIVARLVSQLENTTILLLYGIPKVGKSHLVSRIIDHAHMEQSYLWFTFSGSDADKDRFLFQLASWVGHRTSVWQVRDDIQQGQLQPVQILDRLKKIPIGSAYFVLDDCHKATDKAFLAQLEHLVIQGWTTAKLILISEQKLPDLLLMGIQEVSITGFEPKEGIIYLIKLGIDVSDAITELALLCVQADGHPVLLRAVAAELPRRPSPTDVTSLSATLLTALSVQPFLQVLSERLIRSLRTEAHRIWLTRLAVLTFSFRRGLAMEIAQLKPRIHASPVDWNYLTSQISGSDHRRSVHRPTTAATSLNIRGTATKSKDNFDCKC